MPQGKNKEIHTQMAFDLVSDNAHGCKPQEKPLKLFKMFNNYIIFREQKSSLNQCQV